MESHRYSLSSLIHGLDSDLYIGVHFHPTHADGISIVNIKNKGGQHLICKEDDDLFRRPPEQLEECFCFTKLELLGNKVKRQLWHSSGSWKNQNAEKVVVNNVVIGCVTKLKLHTDNKRPTEWHILEYMDTEKPVAGLYVLCHVYKLENNKDSGSKAKKTMLSSLASRRYAFSSLNPELNSDLFIGFYFAPTDEDLIKFVKKKNEGTNRHPMFKVDDDLFGRLPERPEECYCFTKLEPFGENKVNRQLWDGSGYWKHIEKEKVVVNNKVIGWVTKLRLHWDKKRPTAWHIRAYSDTEMAVADRYVLCRIYKTEKNKDSGSSTFLDPNIDNTTVPDPVASDIGAGQIYPSTSQVSSMWASGARGDMNRVQQNEMGQYSYTQPGCFFSAAVNRYLTGEHLNQDQNPPVGQSWYTTSQAGMDYISQQFPSRSNSIDGSDMGPYQYSNWDPFDELNVIFKQL